MKCRFSTVSCNAQMGIQASQGSPFSSASIVACISGCDRCVAVGRAWRRRRRTKPSEIEVGFQKADPASENCVDGLAARTTDGQILRSMGLETCRALTLRLPRIRGFLLECVRHATRIFTPCWRVYSTAKSTPRQAVLSPAESVARTSSWYSPFGSWSKGIFRQMGITELPARS